MSQHQENLRFGCLRLMWMGRFWIAHIGLGAEVRDAVCRLAGSGVQVVLATARGPQAVRDIVRQFDFAPRLICFSGAWIGELDTQSLRAKKRSG